MRIAVSGTHGVGKTTLIEDFVEVHRGYLSVPEPYWELTEQGALFSDEPSVESFQEQLEQSLVSILSLACEPNILFDRCPLDFIAYLDVLAGSRDDDGIVWESWLPRIEAALATLDLIALVPLPAGEPRGGDVAYPRLRRAVDARLQRLVRDDAHGLLADGPRIVELGGSRTSRVAELSRAISAG
jgi:hypothetical protein